MSLNITNHWQAPCPSYLLLILLMSPLSLMYMRASTTTTTNSITLQRQLYFSFRSECSTLVHSLQNGDKVVSAIGHIPFDRLFMKVAWLIICSNVLCITPHYITVHWIRAGFGQCKSKKCSRVRPMIDYTEYRYLPRP